ncbi:MAG: glycogen synthase [Candidatus Doudnabacteria bacterium]|nr:glycogen synthase [Candidatus Doudnabacteria bacterium]
MNSLRILFVTTEAEPFVAVGGLAAVMHALPVSLKRLGHDARVMIPRYLQIDGEKWNLKMECEGLRVPTENQTGPSHLICNVKRYDPVPSDNETVTTFFLENMEYYEQRANVYGYADDAVRWALLSRGTLEFLKVSSWVPDVIVVTDWHTALLPNMLKTFYQDDTKLSRIATVHSIHNLAHQMSGVGHRFVSPDDTDDGYSLLPAFEDAKLLKINGTKRGIIYSDAINTVSPTYAREIATPQYGEGLDELLLGKKDRLMGIMNGLNYALWDPAHDPLVEHKFSAENLAPRAKNKAVLQKHFELPIYEDYFVVAIVSRMTVQKGIDLLEPVIPVLLQDLPLQLIVLGEGDSRIMEFFLNLKKIYPERIGAKFSFDPDLPHLIFDGADAALIPSRFEPSGLTQMEAMTYGCIPIVRRTGGLADTVKDCDSQKHTGTGFVFEKADSLSLMIAIVRAYESFRHKEHWEQLQKRAMQTDFSWENSARQYVSLFQRAIKAHEQSG